MNTSQSLAQDDGCKASACTGIILGTPKKETNPRAGLVIFAHRQRTDPWNEILAEV